jgi:hypothetical protein
MGCFALVMVSPVWSDSFVREGLPTLVPDIPVYE